ncbi:MAG: hypothetical protein V1722_01945 [Candidatus Micrarchaeota archaeon]
MAETKSLVNDIAHILVLLVLLLVLLVIVTKFKVIHPSVIPGWQGVFCEYVEQKHSVVGIVYGSDGLGNPEELEVILSRLRPTMRVEMVKLEDVSPALLSRYEVIVIERSRTVPFRFVNTLSGYLDGGGSLIWTGDAMSNQVLGSRDITEANQQDQLRYAAWLKLPENKGKDYTAWLTEKYEGKEYTAWIQDNNAEQGAFGEFGSNYLGAYLKTERSNSATSLVPVLTDHLILSGIPKFQLPLTNFGVVNQNDDYNIIANIEHNGEIVPGILEKKYVGRILYFAFPLEVIDSPTFLDNIFDYLVTC